ncbi:hypothetical protein NKG94_10690 [Micromonospora sp. M12]
MPAQRTVALDEAQRAVRFLIRQPAKLGPPEQVLVADPDDTGGYRVATLLYSGRAARRRVRRSPRSGLPQEVTRRARPGSRSTVTSPSGSMGHTRCRTWIAPESSVRRPPGWPPRR